MKATITDLPAGEELDALVAQKVMGGTAVHPDWYWWRCTNFPLDEQDAVYAGPRFSTDIADAWPLFGWIVEKTGHCAITAGKYETTDGEMGCVYSGWRSSELHTIYWESLPLALCHLALLIAEEEKERDESDH